MITGSLGKTMAKLNVNVKSDLSDFVNVKLPVIVEFYQNWVNYRK